MAKLPTSNLALTDVEGALGLTPNVWTKDIIQRIIDCCNQEPVIVNKYGLDSDYCPGANADARLTNLQTDKALKYFKGYDHDLVIDGDIRVEPSTVTFTEDDLSGTTKQVTLKSPGAWSRTAINYGSGPAGWYGTSPTSGSATAGITITVTLNVDNPQESWIGAYARHTDSVHSKYADLVVAIEAPI